MGVERLAGGDARLPRALLACGTSSDSGSSRRLEDIFAKEEDNQDRAYQPVLQRRSVDAHSVSGRCSAETVQLACALNTPGTR